jgi:NADPH2:quinone reductase
VINARGSLFLTRPKLADYIATRAEFADRAESVLGAVASRSLKLCVHIQFPLARAADAHKALESRATTGKLLLVTE